MAYMKAYPPITTFTATKDEVVGRGDLEAVFTTELALVTTATGTGSREEVRRKQAGRLLETPIRYHVLENQGIRVHDSDSSA